MVRNNAVAQRMHSDDIAGGTAQHIPCLCAHLQDFAGILVHSNHRGLPYNNALITLKDQHIGRSQVNT